MPNNPEGFRYVIQGGEVVISHHGKHAGTLRGSAADRFLNDLEQSDPQEVMARVTGNYKRGNESVAKNHPRNMGNRRA